MDRSTPTNVVEASTQPTVASILGVTGALRFHPHGSTQKAHVVLRRVDAPEDAEEEADPSTVYFSLFAQKRIEVKPGKEILLAVAAPDGRIIDTPVILAAKVTRSESPERHPLSQEERMHVVASTKELAVPPKMRKSWSKRFDLVQPTASTSRSYTSTSVQTVPRRSPSRSEREPSKPPTATASRPDTSEGRASRDTNGSKEASARTVPSRRDKSLSPMELDSPGSSAPSSPHIPTPQPHTSQEPKSASFSPPGLWISTSPPKEFVLDPDAHITPLHLSPDSGDPPGLSSFPPPSQASSPTLQDSSPQPVAAHSAASSSASPVVNNKADVPHVPTVSAVPVPAPPSQADPSAPNTPTAVPYVPKRKIVPNPFVSGGLLTDFVGATSQKSPPSEGHGSSSDATNIRAASTASAKSLSPPPGLSTAPAAPAVEQPKDDSVFSIAASDTMLTISPPPTRTKSPPVASPSPASSSKVKVEDVPIPSTSPPAPPPAPHTRFSAPHTIPLPGSLFPPNLPLDARPPASVPRRWPEPLPPDTSPPPDPKTLAYIPTGSYSNPLNIRPSVGAGGAYGWRARGALPPPTPPTTTPGPPRKPVAIGAGWPYNTRLVGGGPVQGPGQGQGRRPTFRRASNAAEGSVLPSQEAAFRMSLANGAGPGSGDESAMGMGVRSRSSSGTWTAPGDAPHLPFSLDTAHPPDDSRSASLPMTGSPARSPVVPTRGRSQSGSTSSDPSANNHPLPPKPPAPATPPTDGAYSPRQGVKRMGSPVPPSAAPEARRARTSIGGGTTIAPAPPIPSAAAVVPTTPATAVALTAAAVTPTTGATKWPVSEPVHAVRIKGEGDVGVRAIVHNSDGGMLAVTCYDKSVRIWNNKIHSETAKLAHNMQVAAVAWMERDAGVATLGENGIVSTWTRSAGNKWQWAKILDASDRKADTDSPSCLAFWRDRIAIGYPRSGVKVWLFIQGTWLPQRSIIRQNVTVIKFVEDGDALVGGTTDGVLWYCQVPNGTLRAYSFLKSKIYSLDVDPKETHALAAQLGGRAHLVNIGAEDHKGSVEQVYALSDPELAGGVAYDFGALFAHGGAALLFGCARGCVLVWDRKSGEVVRGLQHAEEGVTIQAVSSFDRGHVTEGHTLTGTRQGLLTWFAHPPSEMNGHLPSR